MNIFLYLMTVIVWGSTWFAITFQLGSIPIQLSIFYRFALAAILLFVWCFYKKLSLKFSLKNHLFFLAQGFFLFSMNYLAAYAASHYIESGLNAIGFSMVLLFNIINAYIFFRTPLTQPILFGAGCGLIGIMITFWPALATLDVTNESFLGVFLSLLGGVLASFGNIISARNQKNNISVTESNAFAMGYGALLTLGIIGMRGDSFDFDFSASYILSLLYLSVFGSIVAFGCYLSLVGRMGPSKAAYSLVMVPIVALLISTIFESFVWESHIFLGIALIIFGNVIILWKKRTQKERRVESLSTAPLTEAA